MLAKPRYQRIWKTALLPLVDFVSILAGILVVYLIRYSWFEGSFLGNTDFNLKQYTVFSVSVGLSVVFLYAVLGLYEIYGKKDIVSTFTRLLFGVSMVLLSIITYYFFNEYNRQALPQGVPISRFVLATGGFVALYFVVLGRLFFWTLEQLLFQLGIGQINICVVGDLDGNISRKLSKSNSVAKFYAFKELNPENFKKIQKLIKNQEIEELYLLQDFEKLGFSLAQMAERLKVNFIFSPVGVSQYQSFGLVPITIEKRLLLEIKHSNLDGWQVVLKRFFDIVFSLIFIIAFSWLYLIIALAVKLDSPGSIFYLSERVGPNGKVFKLWKFRRLRQEFCTSEDLPETLEFEKKLIKVKNHRPGGVLYKIDKDPRSTRIGNFLEKTSLDEIPQFFNVLIGDMSLVGPRPHQPREVKRYKDHHYKVFNINPGLTGWAQINGRSELTFEEEVKLDVYYIENWSFWLDIFIIIKTPLAVLLRNFKSKV